MRIEQKDDYIERLEAKLFPQGRPIHGQIDLTYRCNLNCRHCFIVRDENKQELNCAEIMRIIDELYLAGVLHLTFSGGEPFLREDFLDIYTYARKKGFLITIFTNGILITKTIAEHLARFPPFAIEITFNGISQQVYEQITQVPGSFARARQAIGLLKEKKIPLVLKCNGMTINRDEILRIKQFSDEFLGRNRFRFDPVLYAGRDGSQRPCSLRLTPDEIVDIQHADEDMFSASREQFLHPQQSRRVKEGYLFPCGLVSFVIDPYARLRLCSFIRNEYINLRKEAFLKGFIRLYSKFRSLKFKTDSKCRSCKIGYLCRQCPGRASAETGSMERPVEFFCQLAHQQQKIHKEVGQWSGQAMSIKK